MSEINLSTFPDSKLEALALLYVQSQNLSDKSPSEILDMYDDAYQELRNHQKKKRTAKKADF